MEDVLVGVFYEAVVTAVPVEGIAIDGGLSYWPNPKTKESVR